MARIERPYFYTAVDLDFRPLGPYDEIQHITVTPPVTEREDAPLASVVDELRKRARLIGTFTISIADIAMFGADNTIAVRKISDPSGMLMHTHRRMMDALAGYGYQVDPTYTGVNYHPHTTLIPGHEDPSGTIHVDNLVIARSIEPGKKEIYATIPLHDIR